MVEKPVTKSSSVGREKKPKSSTLLQRMSLKCLRGMQEKWKEGGREGEGRKREREREERNRPSKTGENRTLN